MLIMKDNCVCVIKIIEIPQNNSKIINYAVGLTPAVGKIALINQEMEILIFCKILRGY